MDNLLFSFVVTKIFHIFTVGKLLIEKKYFFCLQISSGFLFFKKKKMSQSSSLDNIAHDTNKLKVKLFFFLVLNLFDVSLSQHSIFNWWITLSLHSPLFGEKLFLACAKVIGLKDGTLESISPLEFICALQPGVCNLKDIWILSKNAFLSCLTAKNSPNGFLFTEIERILEQF